MALTGNELVDLKEYIKNVVFRKPGGQRFTQDSPILPDVLVYFGTQPSDSRIDLLLTPDWSTTPANLARELSHWLGVADLEPEEEDPYAIASNQSVVAVKLNFRELVTQVLPLSWWWQTQLLPIRGRDVYSLVRDTKLRALVKDQLIEGLAQFAPKREDTRALPDHWVVTPTLIWAARLFWLIDRSDGSIAVGDLGLEPSPGGEQARREKEHARREEIAAHFLDLVDTSYARAEVMLAKEKEHNISLTQCTSLYSINRNRTLLLNSMVSRGTTKADAATRTFETTGKNVCWAVVDSGIDATHPAFRKVTEDDEFVPPFESPHGVVRNNTRIRATFDFTNIRDKLSQTQRRGLLFGRMIDWEEMEADATINLQVPHNAHDYEPPINAHGTHVAGILAADWSMDNDDVDPLGPEIAEGPPVSFQGMCPDIELYDLRVLNAQGEGDEFGVMAALQFVRRLNQRHDALEIHGVNLSLGMFHEVSNYGCGSSPICEECTRIVGTGVVVVAAAGNDGLSLHTTPQRDQQEGFRGISITDPGNTEAVITVGSTHRNNPHTYGVSYFSSRGPTGDGRIKPDLVAPGEKIESTVPGSQLGMMDGTSQAAPHVSGAAALIMSRQGEFIGHPDRIKKVLMDSATDLGRERYFQGAGLVDVFRALQNI